MSNKEFVEIPGLQRITKKLLQEFCKKDSLYQTPHLNDRLYLHFKGFQSIENLEEYTGLKCLWLESNAISEIQGLENQTELRSLFLHNNLIQKIENLQSCKLLDTLNLSSNHITKIENCGFNVLPVLSTLNLSRNYLRTSEALQELVACKNLHCLDLSQNRIDDILVVKIFAKMPELRVLILQGNPVVSRIPQYRKTMILECKKLTFLDNFPVSPKDRACAAAWKRGGFEEEQNELKRWGKKDRRKMRRDINATLILRKEKGAEDIHLLESTDEEEDYNQPNRSKQKFEITAPLDVEIPGINLSESTNDSLDEAKTDSHTEDSSHSAGNSSSTSSAVFSSSETSSTKESENLEKAFSNELPSLTKNEGVTSTKHGEGQDPSSTLSNEEDYQKVVSVKTTSEKAFHAAEGFDEKNIDDLESRKESLNEAKKESSAENFSNSEENSSSTSSTKESENLEKASIDEQNELTSLTSDKNEEDQGPSSNLSNEEKNQLVNQQVDAVESTFDETFPAEGVLDEKNINDSESREESLNEAKKKSHIKDSSHSAENSSPNSTTKEAEHLEKASRDDHNELPLLTSDNNEGVVSTKHEEDQGPSSILSNEEGNQQVASVESNSEEAFPAEESFNEKNINDSESRKEPLKEAKKESLDEDSSRSAENTSSTSPAKKLENLELPLHPSDENERVMSTEHGEGKCPSSTLSNEEENQKVVLVESNSKETFSAEGFTEKNINDSESRKELLSETKKESHIEDSSHSAENSSSTSPTKQLENLERTSINDNNELSLPLSDETEHVMSTKHGEDQGPSSILTNEEENQQVASVESTSEETFTAKGALNEKSINDKESRKESPLNEAKKESHIEDSSYSAENSSLASSTEESENLEKASRDDHNGLTSLTLEKNERVISTNYDQDQGPSATLSNGEKNELVNQQVHSVLNASEETFPAEGALNEKNIPAKDETETSLEKKPTEGETEVISEKKPSEGQTEAEVILESLLEPIFDVPSMEETEDEDEYEVDIGERTKNIDSFKSRNVDFEEPICFANFKKEQSLLLGNVETVQIYSKGNHLKVPPLEDSEETVFQGDEDQGPWSTLSNEEKNKLVNQQVDSVLNASEETFLTDRALDEKSIPAKVPSKEISSFPDLERSNDETDKELLKEICMASLQNCQKTKFPSSESEKEFIDKKTLETEVVLHESKEVNGESDISLTSSESVPAQFNTFTVSEPTTSSQVTLSTSLSSEPNNSTFDIKESNTCSSDSTGVIEYDIKEYEELKKSILLESQPQQVLNINYQLSESNFADTELSFEEFENEEIKENIKISKEKAKQYIHEKICQNVEKLQYTESDLELYFKNVDTSIKKESNNSSLESKDFEDSNSGSKSEEHLSQEKSEEENDTPRKSPAWFNTFLKGLMNLKECEKDPLLEDDSDCPQNDGLTKCSAENVPQTSSPKENQNDSCGNVSLKKNVTKSEKTKIEDEDFDKTKEETDPSKEEKPTKNSFWANRDFRSEDKTASDWLENYLNEMKDEKEETIQNEDITHEQTSPKTKCSKGTSVVSWLETNIGNKELYLIKELKDKASQKSDESTPKSNMEDYGIATDVDDEEKDSKQEEEEDPCEDLLTELEKFPKKGETKKIEIEMGIERSEHEIFEEVNKNIKDFKKRKDDLEKLVNSMNSKQDPSVLLENMKAVLNTSTESYVKAPPLEDRQKAEFKGEEMNQASSSKTKQSSKTVGLLKEGEILDEPSKGTESSEKEVEVEPIKREESEQANSSKTKQSSKTVGLLEGGEILDESNGDTESSGKEAEVEPFKREESIKGNSEDEEQALSWWETKLAAGRKEASETRANEDNPTSVGQCQKAPLEKNLSEDETEIELEKKPTEDHTEAKVSLESNLEQSRSNKYPISDIQAEDESENSIEKKAMDDETEVLSEKKPSEAQTEAEVILEGTLEPIFDVPPLEESEDEEEYEVEVKDTNKIIEEITEDIEDFKSRNADFEEPICSANFKEEQSLLLENVETVQSTSAENYVKIPPLEESEETVLQGDEINQMGSSEIKQKTVKLLEERDIVEKCSKDTESSGVELSEREESIKGNREDEEQVLSWWDTTLAAARTEASETRATANEDNPTGDGQCQKVPLERNPPEDETAIESGNKPTEDQTEAEVILESILEQSRSKEYPISDVQPLEETKDETTISSFENNHQPLHEVLSTFNEVVEKIPNRDKQKSKILKNLIENPLTKSISAQTGDEINRQFDEMNRERRQRLSQMIDQVYSQKDKYDDTLEVVDGRLMIVERSTGALLSVPPPPPSRTAGSTEYTCCGLSTTQTSCNDDSNSDDYGTALSENDDVDDIEQHASDTKIKKILLHKHPPPQISEEGANESLALSSSGSCTKMKREENENSHRDDTHQQFQRRVVKLHQEIDAEVPPSEVSQWLVGEDKTSVRVTVDDNRIVLAKRTSSDKEEIMLMGKFSAAMEANGSREGGGKEYVSELQVELGNSTQTFMDLGEAALEDIALIFELPHNGQ